MALFKNWTISCHRNQLLARLTIRTKVAPIKNRQGGTLAGVGHHPLLYTAKFSNMFTRALSIQGEEP